jgi:hypothetical protein
LVVVPLQKDHIPPLTAQYAAIARQYKDKATCA